LQGNREVYCLGEIVHNQEEIRRLEKLGMKTINNDALPDISNAQILVRAHGEPPSTFLKIENNNNSLFEGTCPIVKQIQKKIKKAWDNSRLNGGQVVIYGKKGHAEVIGFMGQTNNDAILVTEINDLKLVDFKAPIELFSQTTMDNGKYAEIAKEVEKCMQFALGIQEVPLVVHKTICGHVSGRGDKLKLFARKHDVVLFVSGTNSSNGKVLFELCRSVNERSFWVENELQIEKKWFDNARSVGICGATSTPRWLMEKIANCIKNL
jgi:4-hydroxy-3-methylbut-2-en-1-yl diphosphate reductase